MGSFLSAFEPVILVLHFIVAFFLIVTILLQPGKGSDIGAAFGAGGSGSLFGARGASTLLSKITVVVAMVFLLTSLSLATTAKFKAFGGGSAGSLIADELRDQEELDAPSEPTETKDAESVGDQ